MLVWNVNLEYDNKTGKRNWKAILIPIYVLTQLPDVSVQIDGVNGVKNEMIERVFTYLKGRNFRGN